jgi:hypothetical protein
MPPMDLKDWWLAAVAATSIVSPLTEAATQVGDRVGVVTAARQSIKSVSGDRVMYVGNDVQYGERLATDGSGALHILFMDQSSITLGPNSAMTIDQFVFHPEKQEGQIKVNLLKGALRVVGGLVSKFSDTQVVTGNGTIGIRGGITIAEASEDQTLAIFLFGQHMQMTPMDGRKPRIVTRPGFGVISKPDGLSDPIRIQVAQFSELLARFESRINLATEGEILTPLGQLVSTEGQPLGVDTPGKTLASDRLDQALKDINARDPEKSVQELLGETVNPIQS